MCGDAPAPLAPSYLELEERLAAAEADVAMLRAGLQTIADRACHEVRNRDGAILWCPDHMEGGRAHWCDSCEARAVLAGLDDVGLAPSGEVTRCAAPLEKAVEQSR